jgi:hypothetical protein
MCKYRPILEGVCLSGDGNCIEGTKECEVFINKYADFCLFKYFDENTCLEHSEECEWVKFSYEGDEIEGCLTKDRPQYPKEDSSSSFLSFHFLFIVLLILAVSYAL